MNALRGPVLPSLLAVGIAAASVAGIVALTGTKSKAHHASPTAPAGPPPIRNAAWTVNGAHDAASLSTLSGFWIGSDVVVRGGLDGLHAMKRSDGTPAWDLPTPGGGTVCGMSAATDSGVGILVSRGPGGTAGVGCAAVSAVDVATGKVLWTTGVSVDFGTPDAAAADYAAASGVAVIASDQDGTDTGVIGLDLRTGIAKWHHTSGCVHLPTAFAVTGGRVALAETCQGQSAIHVLNAATGDPVPGVPTPPLTDAQDAQILSADPLAYLNGSSPQKLTFAPGTAAPAMDLSSVFARLPEHGPSRAVAADGGGVLCVGGRQATCWTATGSALSPRGLPTASADHHDVYVVSGTADAARVITTGVDGHRRASLCRIAADGGVTVEADLSQPVSDYLGKNGFASDYYAYGDAKDLYLVDPHPAGNIEIIDVRLS